jgi:hypothetical protein
VGDVEQWIADQWWDAIPGGWEVRGQFHRWTFQLAPVPAGVRVLMSAAGEQRADWIVPTARSRSP